MPSIQGVNAYTLGILLPDELKEAISDRPLVWFTLMVDREQTEWNNPDANVTISILYIPQRQNCKTPNISSSGTSMERVMWSPYPMATMTLQQAW